MAKKRKEIPEEASFLGRYIGTLERTGSKEMIEEIRAMAKAEGKTLTDKLTEIIRAGLDYTRYEKLTLADAMRVLDFIERSFNNFIYPVMYQATQLGLQTEIEKIRTIAQSMGLIPKEIAEKMAEEKALEYLQAVQEQEALKQQQQQVTQPKEEGPITRFIKKLSERIAERLGDKVIETIEKHGALEDFVDVLADTTIKVTKQALLEEITGEGEENEQEDENKH